MKTREKHMGQEQLTDEKAARLAMSRALFLAFLVGMMGSFGCASTQAEKEQKEGFFTSGSPEADRRAEQIAPEDKKQAAKARERKSNESSKAVNGGTTNAQQKVTLYERLGGEPGIRAIIDDFVKRASEDPRVNWSRQGVTKRGFLRREKVAEWKATPENVNRLKEHFVQFISLASGGPAKYEGKPVRPTHALMEVTKAEFDATIGDLKATLDKLNVSTDVQKDLLSIFESTRPEIVLQR